MENPIIHLQKVLLTIILEVSDGNLDVGVKKAHYARALDYYNGRYGEVDLALAMINLYKNGYITKRFDQDSDAIYLTEFGLLAKIFSDPTSTST